MKRLILITVAVFLLMAGSASAYTIQGGDAAHRGAVASVLNSQPWVVNYIESVWPNFYVRINYGGHAWNGYMDVNRSLWGKAFTQLVSHELMHMVQLAGDAPGGPPSIGDKWLASMTASGYGPNTWDWWNPWRNPWEAFAENARRAFYSPYYGAAQPQTQLDWYSRAEMTEFMRSVGVL